MSETHSDNYPYPENAQFLANYAATRLSLEEQAIIAQAGEDVYKGFALLVEHRKQTPEGQAMVERIQNILKEHPGLLDTLDDD